MNKEENKNISKKMSKKKKKLIIILSVIAVFIAGAAIAGSLYFKSIQKNLDQMAGTEISNVDLTKVPDGRYIGDCAAFPVAAEVAVTVKDHVITAIDLLKHTNGKGGAAEVLPAKVVENPIAQAGRDFGCYIQQQGDIKSHRECAGERDQITKFMRCREV